VTSSRSINISRLAYTLLNCAKLGQKVWAYIFGFKVKVSERLQLCFEHYYTAIVGLILYCQPICICYIILVPIQYSSISEQKCEISFPNNWSWFNLSYTFKEWRKTEKTEYFYNVKDFRLYLQPSSVH